MEKITANEIVEKLRNGELESPIKLSDYLVILSASINTGGQMELETEIGFATKWQELRPESKTDKECDMRAKLTEEYKLMRRAQIANKTILECIRSLKKKLGAMQTEYGEGQNY
jgi:hypothetical protein